MLSAYDEGILSDADEDLIEKYTKDYNDAMARGDTAGMQAAHDAAEAVRAGHGYSGGEEGNLFVSLINPDIISSSTGSSGGVTVGNAGIGGAGVDFSAAGVDNIVKIGAGVLFLVIVMSLFKR